MNLQTEIDFTEEAATDVAINRAGANASKAWKEAAESYVCVLAATGEPFTSQDALALMERERPELKTHELRAMGAIIRVLMGKGVIYATGDYVKSTRTGCHNQPKRVLRGTTQTAGEWP